jgi:hypothetical protein
VRLIAYLSVAWFLTSIAAALFLGRLCGLSSRLELAESESGHYAFDAEVGTVAIYAINQDPSRHGPTAWESAAQ